MGLAAELAAVVDRPGLPPGLRCLALLHGAAVTGRFDAVAALVDLARERGVPPERLHETALQVVAYGGFPRAIEALALVADGSPPSALDAAEARSRPALAAEGRAAFQRVYGDAADAVLQRLHELLPGFPTLVLEVAYGRILARPLLPLGERELLGVAALALAALPAPLDSHVRGALRNGFSPADVDDILVTCSVLAGPQGASAIALARDRLSRKVYRT